jgi:hypothetical protein
MPVVLITGVNRRLGFELPASVRLTDGVSLSLAAAHRHMRPKGFGQLYSYDGREYPWRGRSAKDVQAVRRKERDDVEVD